METNNLLPVSLCTPHLRPGSRVHSNQHSAPRTRRSPVYPLVSHLTYPFTPGVFAYFFNLFPLKREF